MKFKTLLLTVLISGITAFGVIVGYGKYQQRNNPNFKSDFNLPANYKYAGFFDGNGTPGAGPIDFTQAATAGLPTVVHIKTERCARSGATRVEFHHLSLFDVAQLPGEYDLINSVGVLHHTPDPIRGIQALAGKLAPGGLMHIFVYGELGRWEIELMQKAIGMLQGDKRGDYQDGVKIGRSLFASLPANNRLVKREKERWAMENHKDECFADMYVHPQEIDYNIETLFELIDASGLDFVGFSNPDFWNLERLLAKAPEALERAQKLDIRQQYRLIELLDTDIAHYEFFLAKPPLPTPIDWSQDEILIAAIPHRHPCIEGWESQNVFNCDWKLVNLSDAEFAFVQACDKNQGQQLTVGEILEKVELSIENVRSLLADKLIMVKQLTVDS